MNELFFYVILCLSYSFTPYNPDQDARLTIGNLCNQLVIFLILINMLYVLVMQIHHLYRLLKRKFDHRRQKAARRKQRELIEKQRLEFALKN